jgi:hypothetical protein
MNDKQLTALVLIKLATQDVSVSKREAISALLKEYLRLKNERVLTYTCNICKFTEQKIDSIKNSDNLEWRCPKCPPQIVEEYRKANEVKFRREQKKRIRESEEETARMIKKAWDYNHQVIYYCKNCESIQGHTQHFNKVMCGKCYKTITEHWSTNQLPKDSLVNELFQEKKERELTH